MGRIGTARGVMEVTPCRPPEIFLCWDSADSQHEGEEEFESEEEEDSQRLLLVLGLLLLLGPGLLLFLSLGLLLLLRLGPHLLLVLGLLLLLALGLLLLLESKREEEECQRKKDRQVGGSLERGVQNGGIFVRFLATVNT